ncbi:MAG TPA: GTP-binding protein [Limnochordia bacterium]
MAVEFIIVGGFLGSGKTTSLTRFAQVLGAQGRRVGLITNDQAAELVDTELAGRLCLPVGEVAGGCFCCRFPDLLAQAETLVEHGVDTLLAEPVGSCTDLVATVYEPLRRFAGDRFRLAPFSVLLDPVRVSQILLGEGKSPLSARVAYLYAKQIEEADLVVLNKVDTLGPAERARLMEGLSRRYSNRRLLGVSATTGEGFDDWLAMLLSPESSRGGRHLSIDYTLYAAAEAELGWLNGSVVLGAASFDGTHLLRTFLSEAQQQCARAGGEIAHLKVWVSTDSAAFRISLVRSDGTALWDGGITEPVSRLSLTVNARVAMEPEALEAAVRNGLAAAAAQAGAAIEEERWTSFRPAPPQPTYRFDAAAQETAGQ